MKDPKKFVGIAGTITAVIGLFITVGKSNTYMIEGINMDYTLKKVY